jgi:hypothetical protein
VGHEKIAIKRYVDAVEETFYGGCVVEE